MSLQKERNGQFTGELGRILRDEIASKTGGRLRVHFDHAGVGSEKTIVHLGKKSSRANALSFVDIAVVESGGDIIGNEDSKRVVLLCEVEEEGARPKKIIGDLCSVLFADGVQISGHHYHLNNTRLIIGIRRNEKGKSEDKAEEVITKIQNRVSTGSISDIVGVYATSHRELMDALHGEILKSLGVG
jgi:hypothetical protein